MPKIRQEINIVDYAVPQAGTSGIVQLDTTQYVNPTYYFEIVYSNLTASTTINLSRKTGGTNDASISLNISGPVTRARSTSFTPPVGQTEYQVTGMASTTSIKAARIIIIDNPTTLTSTETQIEVGGQGATTYTSTTAVAMTNPKYWLYTAANWDGTKTFFAEVTYKTASTNTATITLQEDNGSFASWADKVTIVSTVSNTSATRTRSSSFTPTDGRHYRIAVKSSTTKSSVTIYNAKVIVDQNKVSLVDSYSESNRDSSFFGLFNQSAAGQSFTGDGNFINFAYLYLNKNGTPTGNAFAKIYSHSGTFGTSGIPSSLLATSDALDVSTVSTSLNLVKFTFSGSNQIQLVNGTNYFIVLDLSSASTVAALPWGEDGSSPTASGNWAVLTNSTWAADSTTDGCFYVYSIPSTTYPTLLEPQYLLLNTADSNATGVQSYQTLWDSTEWSGVSNVYTHAMDSDNASNSAKLRDITASSDVTSSTVTGANQQESSALTMPTSGDEVDTWILNTTGVVAASRIIVASTVNPADDNITVSDSSSVTDSVSLSVTGGSTDLSVNTSDSSAITESIGRMVESYVNKSDSSGVTDSTKTEINSFVNVSDSSGATDSIKVEANNLINVSDSTGVSESWTVLLPFLNLSVSDSTGVTDSVRAEVNSFINKSDTSAVTDSVNLSVSAQVNVSDTTAVTENTRPEINSFVNVSDTSGVTDSTVALIPTLLVSVSDSSTITEALLMLDTDGVGVVDSSAVTENTKVEINSFVNVNDSTGVTDSIKVESNNFVNKSDTSGVTDSIALTNVYGPIVSDSSTVTESTKLEVNSFLNVSDGSSVTENVQLTKVLFVNVSDTSAVTDSVQELMTSFINVSDSSAVTENTSVQIAVTTDLSIIVSDSTSISESILLTDIEGVAVIESSAVTENTQLMLESYVSKSESTAVTENTRTELNSFISASDTSSVTDSPAVFVPFFNISVTDTSGVTDSQNLLETAFISASDSSAVTDSATVYSDENISVSDSSPVSENSAVSFSLNINVSDSSALTENAVVQEQAQAAYQINVSDSVHVSEFKHVIIPGSTTTTTSPQVIFLTDGRTAVRLANNLYLPL